MVEYYIYVMYLICNVCKVNEDCIKYSNCMCGLWVIMIFNEVRYCEFVKFM